MSRCTAPKEGHRTSSGRANCPACGGSGYGYRGYSSSYSTPVPTVNNDNFFRNLSSGSTRSVRPKWSPATSKVTYTPEQVRSLDPIHTAAELRAQANSDLRDLFICHAWDDRRGTATDLANRLDAVGVSTWFSERDVAIGKPFMREIDRGLSKCRAGLVLVTPDFLKRVDAFGVSDKELSVLLQRDLLFPIVHDVTYDQLREQSPLLASRNGFNTAEDSWETIAIKISELMGRSEET